MPARKKVVIIGAGVGSLALAPILAKAGFDVAVYEKTSAPGGRMGKLEKNGFTYDTGPSWYLMKDVFEHYFGLFGKRTSDYYDLIRLNPAYKVFFQTRDPITITGELDGNLNTFEQIEPGAASALTKYIANGEKNYHSALKYFLYNNFTRPYKLLNKGVLAGLPALLPVISSSLHAHVSSRFHTKELQQILEYPSVFLGASPFNTPALYQLMSYLDFKEGVFYPRSGGMHSVIDSLVSLGGELGVKYKYDTEISQIHTINGQATGIQVNDETILADAIVANSDLHHTETQLLKSSDRSYKKKFWKKSQAGPSALLLYLGIDGQLPELEHHNLFFVSDWRKNFDDIYADKQWPNQASMYVSKTSATDHTTAPKGQENIFVLIPLPPGVSKNESGTELYMDMYLEQLEKQPGIPNFRQRIISKEVRTPDYFGEHFNSWQNTALGMSHTLRQSAFFRPSVKSKKLKNLYYVGGGVQPGIGVPMCIISAQLVYKHLAGDHTPGRPEIIKDLS